MPAHALGVTLNVWLAALGYAAYGTGMIEATRQELAEQAGTNERDTKSE